MSPESSEACNVCGTRDEPTFEAGGAWWCAGCSRSITDAHVEEDRCTHGGPMFKVVSDNHSNHYLPIGAHVELLRVDGDVALYTQGIEGDEVAIDPRDLRPI